MPQRRHLSITDSPPQGGEPGDRHRDDQSTLRGHPHQRGRASPSSSHRRSVRTWPGPVLSALTEKLRPGGEAGLPGPHGTSRGARTCLAPVTHCCFGPNRALLLLAGLPCEAQW